MSCGWTAVELIPSLPLWLHTAHAFVGSHCSAALILQPPLQQQAHTCSICAYQFQLLSTQTISALILALWQLLFLGQDQEETTFFFLLQLDVPGNRNIPLFSETTFNQLWFGVASLWGEGKSNTVNLIMHIMCVRIVINYYSVARQPPGLHLSQVIKQSPCMLHFCVTFVVLSRLIQTLLLHKLHWLYNTY